VPLGILHACRANEGREGVRVSVLGDGGAARWSAIGLHTTRWDSRARLANCISVSVRLSCADVSSLQLCSEGGPGMGLLLS